MGLRGWNIRFGRWWMVQWQVDGWLSLGVHVDLRSRVNELVGDRYGPYVDVHLGCVIVSVGRNPVWAGELEAMSSVARGGRRV